MRGTNLIGKPYQFVSYNNLQVPIYKSEALRKILRLKDPVYFRDLRSAGLIQQPMFTAGQMGYYSMWELASAQAYLMEMGGIKFHLNPPKHNEVTRELMRRMSAVQQSLRAGKFPDTPLIISYKSRDDFEKDMNDILLSANVDDPSLAKQIADVYFQTYFDD